MEIGREDKLDELGRILESRSMHGSENLKSFLKFVVDKSLGDGADQLKEYTIATEVFGRSNHFSPRNDSVVRVQASRLRSKLHEYYATEGKADPVRIELPKGHYSPVFSVIDREQEEGPATPNPAHEPNGGIATTTQLTTANEISRTWKERRWLLAALGVTLLGDRLSMSVIGLAVETSCVAAMVVGVVLIGRSQTLARCGLDEPQPDAVAPELVGVR